MHCWEYLHSLRSFQVYDSRRSRNNKGSAISTHVFEVDSVVILHDPRDGAPRGDCIALRLFCRVIEEFLEHSSLERITFPSLRNAH